jgi:hypothetical protein
VIVVAAVAASVALLAAVPWVGRAVARVVLLWALILAPVIATGVWLALREGTHPAAYTALVPLALIYLATIDLVFGVSARLSLPPRAPPPGRNDERSPADPE